jgi:hypothetical protein
MATVTTNHAHLDHRARILAEAVTSAYIHEIARPAPRPEPARTHGGRIHSLNAAVRPLAPDCAERRPVVVPRHRDAHELAA